MIDRVGAHVHVFPSPSNEFPREVSRLAPAHREAKAEQLLRDMDAAGVDRAVLIHIGGTRIEHHRYVAHCVHRWPDRFAATGLVDLNASDPSARLEKLVEATGIEGIRLRGDLGDPHARVPQDLRIYGLLQRAEELDININIYTQSAQLRCIEMLIRAFPRLKISLDHLGICPSSSLEIDRWGRPRFENEPIPPAVYPSILQMAAYPNVYIKVSGEYAFSREPYPYADIKPMVDAIYRAYGPERMMWCSDFPWIVEEPGYGRLVNLINHHLPSISPHERDMIMGGNALKIWFRR